MKNHLEDLFRSLSAELFKEGKKNKNLLNIMLSYLIAEAHIVYKHCLSKDSNFNLMLAVSTLGLSVAHLFGVSRGLEAMDLGHRPKSDDANKYLEHVGAGFFQVMDFVGEGCVEEYIKGGSIPEPYKWSSLDISGDSDLERN